MLAVRREEGPGRGKLILLDGSTEVSFGRADHCLEILSGEDLTVGREHFAIKSRHGQFLLVDRGSRNGTFLNGVRLKGKGEPVELKTGDRIGAGKSVFTVRLLSQPVCAVCGKAIGGLLPDPDAPEAAEISCRACSARRRPSPSETIVVRSDDTEAEPAFRPPSADSAPPFSAVAAPWELLKRPSSLVRNLRESSSEGTTLLRCGNQGGLAVLKYLRIAEPEPDRLDRIRKLASQLTPKHESLGPWEYFDAVREGYVLAFRPYYLISVERRLSDRGGRLTIQDGLAAISRVLGGLLALHSRGLVHGNVTMSNLMMRSDNSEVLVDSGFRLLREFAESGCDQAPVSAGSKGNDVRDCLRLLSRMLLGKMPPSRKDPLRRSLRETAVLPGLARLLERVLIEEEEVETADVLGEIEQLSGKAVRLTVRI